MYKNRQVALKPERFIVLYFTSEYFRYNRGAEPLHGREKLSLV